ncbi:hypothetical protein AB0J28_00495 [Streptosporangium canum]|uniref:hypothetical protein n=1 Tax=Streptosporangium canum TaxID=324952 RepID=UPI0034226072
MTHPDPAVAWLEQQADTYAAGLANPAIAPTLPTAPTHLDYTAEQALEVTS